MNRRKAKKKVKAELGLKKWPFGDLDPRVARALFLDYEEAIALYMDHLILYGESAPRPAPPWSHIQESFSGIHPKRKKEG